MPVAARGPPARLAHSRQHPPPPAGASKLGAAFAASLAWGNTAATQVTAAPEAAAPAPAAEAPAPAAAAAEEGSDDDSASMGGPGGAVIAAAAFQTEDNASDADEAAAPPNAVGAPLPCSRLRLPRCGPAAGVHPGRGAPGSRQSARLTADLHACL
jgi:hypothetical protein